MDVLNRPGDDYIFQYHGEPLRGSGPDRWNTYIGFDSDEILRVSELAGPNLSIALELTVTESGPYIIYLHSETQSSSSPTYRSRYAAYLSGYLEASETPREISLDNMWIFVQGEGYIQGDFSEAIRRGYKGIHVGDSITDETLTAVNVNIIVRGDFENNSPTLNNPVGGSVQNINEPITFSWNHNGTLEQESFELRYRVKGTTTWTTVSETTNRQSYTLPANTLTINEYEWQVRTTSEYGFQSPWSEIGVFSVAETTPAPIILKPLPDEEIGISDLRVEWESPTQYQYEIQLLDENDNIIWSDSKISTAKSIEVKNILENNRTYKVRLRVNEQGGIFSPWVEVEFTVSYTPPAKPIITITPNSEDAYLEIDVYNPPPTGTEPTAVSQELFRREPGGQWVKIANLSPNSKFNDYAVASGKVYEYRAVVLADNDVTNTSDNFPGYVKFNFDVIAVANNPVVFVKLKEDPRRSFSKNFNAIRKQFAGRKQIVTEFGETIGLDSSLGYFVQADDLYKLDEIASRQETLLYRDVRGRKHYITIEQMNVNDEIRLIDHYSVEMTITEVYYKEGVN